MQAPVWPRDVLLKKQAPKQRGWEPPDTGWGSAPASGGLLAFDEGMRTSSPLTFSRASGNPCLVPTVPVGTPGLGGG